MRRTAILFLSLCLVSFPIGCGGGGDTPDLGRVTGTVTIDGKPAENVRVTFSPVEGGRPSTGVTDTKGYYELIYNTQNMGAVIGKHKVSISDEGMAPADDSDDLMASGGGIPEEYLEQSKEVTVEAGSNEIDITFP